MRKPEHRLFRGLVVCLLCIVVAPSLVAATDRVQPNILLVMVDDLGKEWLGCYGAEGIETPHIDALAAGGMRFQNAYSMPQCTPTRVTLLTGQYPWRTGWVNHWDVPRWGVGYFDWQHYTSIARILKTAGYATVAVGKWQINDFRVAPDAMRRHGFDDWCLWTGYETGNPPSADRYWDAYVNTPQGSKTHHGKFGPDVYVDYLVEFIRRHSDQPMFLYYPLALTHGPLVHTPDEPHAATNLDKHKAMVRYTDKCVGKVVDTLELLNLRERTIIVFTTDNGTSRGISNVRNGRLIRGGKADKGEHGVCNPFIVNGPGLVPAGVVTEALTDFSDLLPTCAELAGAKLPENMTLDGLSMAPLLTGEAADSPREWIMALGHGPARLDQSGVRGQLDHAPRVIRDNRYKVWVNETASIAELYDLVEDPYEENNLISDAAHRPALTKFQAVVDEMPRRDARPKYTPRALNPWDKKVE